MIRFGTGGWRAVIGDDFTKENVYRVSQGIYEYMKRENQTDKPVVIGYDRRFLSESAARWIAEVLCANGVTVHFTHRSVPTPLVMFTVKDKGFYFGIEVTASHNPPSYNGIKLIVNEGRDAPLECTQAIEKIIEELDTVNSMPFESAVEKGLVVYKKTPFNDFIDSIIGMLDMSVIRENGPRILFNPMHGSSTYPLMVIMYTARCTLDLMNSNKDAYFGGNMPAPGERELTDLAERVVSENYDLGIALDGDGDRLGIIDKNGEYIDANKILVMLYYYLHEYRGWRGAVVRNLATTHMLDAVAESFGEECHEVPVGFKYISSKLDETDALLGGESSGGLTVRGHIFGKDSIYAASLVVEMFCATGKSPTDFYRELAEKYGSFEMVEDNLVFDIADKDRINDLIMVKREIPEFTGKTVSRVNYEDGCKIYFDDNSFVICRFSGTEPLLRIFAEAKTEEIAQSLIDTVKKFIAV